MEESCAGDAYASRSCQSLTCRLGQGARLGEAQRRHAALVKVGLVDQSFQPAQLGSRARVCTSRFTSFDMIHLDFFFLCMKRGCRKLRECARATR